LIWRVFAHGDFFDIHNFLLILMLKK